MMANSSNGTKWVFETKVPISAFKSQLNNNFKIHGKAPKLMQGFYIAEETNSSITFRLGTALMTTFNAKVDFSKQSPELTIPESPKLDNVNTGNMKTFIGAVEKAFKTIDPQCVMRDGAQ